MTDRSKRFHSRINVERAILSAVNSTQVGRKAPLAGISAGAIDNWSKRASQYISVSRIKSVVLALTEMGTITGLISDNSRGLFASEYISDNNLITVTKEKIFNILNENV